MIRTVCIASLVTFSLLAAVNDASAQVFSPSGTTCADRARDKCAKSDCLANCANNHDPKNRDKTVRCQNTCDAERTKCISDFRC
jgi:hypothetical protein